MTIDVEFEIYLPAKRELLLKFNLFNLQKEMRSKSEISTKPTRKFEEFHKNVNG